MINSHPIFKSTNKPAQNLSPTQKLSPIWLSVFSIFILLFSFTILLHLKHEIADEGFHAPVIWKMYNGIFEKDKNLTTLPVYHAAIAGLLKAVGTFTIPLARFINLLVASLAIPVFYLLCKQLNKTDASIRTLLFLTCPLILPFFSLLYTDIPALAAALAMLLFYFKRHHWISAGFALLAISLRQTNLIWLGFVIALLLLDHWNTHPNKQFNTKTLCTDAKAIYKGLMPYIFVIMATVVFFVLNKSIAVGDSDQHKISVNVSNIYFFLLVNFVIFLPLHISKAHEIVNTIKRSPITIAGLIVCFFIYMATYNHNHQYNATGLSFYIRNIALHYTVDFTVMRAITFIPIAWTALSFWTLIKNTPNKNTLVLLAIFTAASILPLPLIEQRYYIPAIALFIAFSPPLPKSVTLLTTTIYAPISCIVLYGISMHRWFL